ncbi:hypothetical protein HDU84_000706, partial [Entophlyctis sp. JEL0112]
MNKFYNLLIPGYLNRHIPIAVLVATLNSSIEPARELFKNSSRKVRVSGASFPVTAENTRDREKSATTGKAGRADSRQEKESKENNDLGHR